MAGCELDVDAEDARLGDVAENFSVTEMINFRDPLTFSNLQWRSKVWNNCNYEYRAWHFYVS